MQNIQEKNERFQELRGKHSDEQMSSIFNISVDVIGME